MNKLPPHIIFLGALVVIIGGLAAILLIMGSPSHFTPVKIPITLADSCGVSSNVRVHESGRYEFELWLDATPKFGGPWLSKPNPEFAKMFPSEHFDRWCHDPIEIMMESMNLHVFLQGEGDSNHNSLATRYSSFGGRGGSRATNMTSYFVCTDGVPLNVGQTYKSQISLSNVPSEFWGRSAELRIDMGEPQGMSRMFELTTALLVVFIALIALCVVFLIYLIRWMRRKRQVAVDPAK